MTMSFLSLRNKNHAFLLGYRYHGYDSTQLALKLFLQKATMPGAEVCTKRKER